MTKVKMIALDTFSATRVRAEPLRPGDEFEVTEGEAKELNDRRLAHRLAAADAMALRRRTSKRGD